MVCLMSEVLMLGLSTDGVGAQQGSPPWVQADRKRERGGGS